MPVTEEAKLMNEAVFNALATPSAEEKAREAVNSFWRSYMYHKFTGMPKRGMMARIMPPLDVKTKAEWLALGVPEADLRRTKYIKCPDPFGNVEPVSGDQWEPWWNTGQLFYEIAERRLDREDYQRRLAARTVPRWEWEMREQSRRKIARWDRERPENAGLSERIEQFAYDVMGDIVALIGPRGNSG